LADWWGFRPVSKLTGAVTASANSVSVTGISASSSYKAYVVVKDSSGNVSDVAAISFETKSYSGGGEGGGEVSDEGGANGESNTGTNIDITNSGGSGTIRGTLSKTGNGVKVEIDGSDFKSFTESSQSDVVIDTGTVVVTFDEQAADYISKIGGSGNISLTVEQAGKSSLLSLSEDEIDLIGSRPVYDFTLTAGGSVLSQFNGGHVNISIPYTLQPGEDKNAVVVYYIDNSGNLQQVMGNYNVETGNVDITAEHFSLYAVGYNKVDFSDVPESAWYYDAVTFIAARGITTGIGSNMFGPDNTLSRGQFIVMLMRAYNIEPYENPAYNFADAGNTYYTNYIAKAKELGITTGVGCNMYAPDIEISREDMLTLLYRALDVLGKLPKAATGKTLSDFSDASSISDYAKDAFITFVEGGVISGNGGMLNPQDQSTAYRFPSLQHSSD